MKISVITIAYNNEKDLRPTIDCQVDRQAKTL